MNKEEINARIEHLKVLIPFLKTKPIYDINKIPSFQYELKSLKEMLKNGGV